MVNYTLAPEDEYDVLIEGDLENNEIEQCDSYDANTLSTQLVPQLCYTVFVAGLLGNILVVLVLVKYKGLKHMENIYFLNLAVSNVCFLLVLPFWAHAAAPGESLGQPACKVLVGLHALGVYSQALFNTLLTVQRYLVFFQVGSFSPATRMVPCTITTSILVWIMIILVTLPEFMFYKAQMAGQKYKCSFSRPYFLSADETFWKHLLTLKMNILVLVFPLSVFMFCYVRMRTTLQFRESRYGLFKLVFAIMAVFLLMWAPYNIALFLSAFKEYFSLHDCKSNYNLDRSVQITKIIATTHCCFPPLLHVALNKAFRKYLCRLFHLCNNTPLQPREESAQGTAWDQHDHSTEV
ncbi:PREDICTED: C-C chemokine receptor-like 2 isoform X2 [Galeopterus variegatus]|nr:PREDICTED: C-C chemokine receptor-like 2 isoform X2 [Galeopterus variegatus]